MAYQITAQVRDDAQQGKGASRRLRRHNLVPAIIYGADEAPISCAIAANVLVKALEDDAFFASILTITVDGTDHEVTIKALQRHPAKGFPMHADFQRIVRGQLMTFNIPVHFVGIEQAVGTQEGGIFSSTVDTLEIECLPRNLPQSIEIDVSGLAIGDSLHLADVKLPQDVRLTELDPEDESTNRTVATIVAPISEEELEAIETAEVPEVPADEVPTTEQGATEDQTQDEPTQDA